MLIYCALFGKSWFLQYNSPKYCLQLYGKKSTLTFTANLKNKKNSQLTLVSNLGICSTLYQVYGIVGV